MKTVKSRVVQQGSSSRANARTIPLHERINVLMQKTGLTRKQLQAEGVKQSYLSRLLNGEIKSPTLPMCQKIAKALKVTVEDLLLGTTSAHLLADAGWAQKVFCPNPACPGSRHQQLIYNLTEPIRFSTTRFDQAGHENKFCPFCGKELIYQCKHCGKPIERGADAYCMGCGELLFEPLKVKGTH